MKIKIIVIAVLYLLIVSCQTYVDREIIKEEIVTEEFPNYYTIDYYRKGWFKNKTERYPTKKNEVIVQGNLSENLFTQFVFLGKQYDRYKWNGAVRWKDNIIDMDFSFTATYLYCNEILGIDWKNDSKEMEMKFDVFGDIVKIPYRLIDNKSKGITVDLISRTHSAFKTPFDAFDATRLLGFPQQTFVISDATLGTIAYYKQGLVSFKDGLSLEEEKLIIQYASFCYVLQDSVSFAIRYLADEDI